MLTICKTSTYFSRPKYRPIATWPCYCVVDHKGKRVFPEKGEVTLNIAQKYIRTNQ